MWGVNSRVQAVFLRARMGQTGSLESARMATGTLRERRGGGTCGITLTKRACYQIVEPGIVILVFPLTVH